MRCAPPPCARWVSTWCCRVKSRAPANSLPIPKRISCLWVGDKTLRPALLSNLAHNVAALENSDYSLRLFLSTANPGAYEENLRLLAEQAPGLQVLPWKSKRSSGHSSRPSTMPSTTRPWTAMVGKRCAALPLLHHEGGCTWTSTTRYGCQAGQPSWGTTGNAHRSDSRRSTVHPGRWLAASAADGQRKLSMNCLYNTSQIGSHPGNPTLEAISEEMHARFRLYMDVDDTLRVPGKAGQPQLGNHRQRPPKRFKT